MCWVWALVRHFLFTLGLNDSLLYWPLFQPVHQISNSPGQGLSLLQARRTKTPPCQGKLMRTWFVVDQVREVLGVGGKVWPYCAHCHQPHATMLPAFLLSLRRPGWRGCDVVSVSEVRQLQQENEASLGKLQETAEQFEWLCQQQRYWMCCVKRWVFSAWPQTGIYTHTQLMKVTSQKSRDTNVCQCHNVISPERFLNLCWNKGVLWKPWEASGKIHLCHVWSYLFSFLF